MRGRTIYFLNRRIFVFCGYKRNTPHSIYDVFGRAAETATTGENNETFTTESSEFAESESGGGAGSDNDTFITASEWAETENGLSISHIAKGTVYADVFAAANSDLSVINDSKATNTETKLSNVESGAATLETAKALKTTVRLSEAENVIATGNVSEVIKTEQHERAETESGISSQQENKAKNTNALLSESESGVSMLQDAEAYVEQPAPQYVIQAGRYISNSIPLSPPLPTMDMIDTYVFYTNYEEERRGYGLAVMSIAGVITLYVLKADQSVEAIGQESMVGLDPNKRYIAITTDDSSFILSSDTEVTAEQFDVFYRYFQLADNNNA